MRPSRVGRRRGDSKRKPSCSSNNNPRPTKRPLRSSPSRSSDGPAAAASFAACARDLFFANLASLARFRALPFFLFCLLARVVLFLHPSPFLHSNALLLLPRMHCSISMWVVLFGVSETLGLDSASAAVVPPPVAVQSPPPLSSCIVCV